MRSPRVSSPAAHVAAGPGDGPGSTGGEIPWLALGPSGEVSCVVYACDGLAALRAIPPGTSLYVGGPSAEHPQRPWWVANWPREGAAR